MTKPKSQTVYLPVKTKDRLPDKENGYFTIHKLPDKGEIIGTDIFSIENKCFLNVDNYHHGKGNYNISPDIWLEEKKMYVMDDRKLKKLLRESMVIGYNLRDDGASNHNIHEIIESEFFRTK